MTLSVPDNLSMARWPTPAPGLTNLSFFLCSKKTEWLDGKHIVFGRLLKGWTL
ncbi:Peptidyl-prolyl cis-trans isomerase 1 [Linum perenne]